MTEKKTAEEIYKHVVAHTGARCYLSVHINATGEYLRKDIALIAMREYAAQELSEYKARLKGLIEARKKEHENDFDNDSYDKHAYGKLCECRELFELIDKL